MTPSDALIAIWKYVAVTGQVLGYSAVPDAPSDLTTLNPVDAVWICVRTPATLIEIQPRRFEP